MKHKNLVPFGNIICQNDNKFERFLEIQTINFPNEIALTSPGNPLILLGYLCN